MVVCTQNDDKYTLSSGLQAKDGPSEFPDPLLPEGRKRLPEWYVDEIAVGIE